MDIPITILSESGLAKDTHPMGAKLVSTNGKPISPELLNKWIDIEGTLKTYQIESIKCDSGIIVSNKVLHWHIGKNYKANIINDNLIQVI